MQLVVTAVITAVCILYYWQNKIDIVFIMGKSMYDKRMFFSPFIVIDIFNSPINYTSFKRGSYYQ